MGAKSSVNTSSFQNSEFCQNFTIMDIESSNNTVITPLEPIDADDDDQMPPLEPIEKDNDDQLSSLEFIYNRYIHFANLNSDAITSPDKFEETDQPSDQTSPVALPPSKLVVEGFQPSDQNIESCPIVFTNDTIVNTVIESFISRSNLGFKKYNKTLDREDLSTVDWVNHTQEELMDAILYLERLKKNFRKK